MSRLICLFPVLIGNSQYEAGDELPTDNQNNVDAWIECQTAKWKEDLEETEDAAPKAKLVTAEPGRTGEANPTTGSEQDLIGKVPSGMARGAMPGPRRRGKKRSD